MKYIYCGLLLCLIMLSCYKRDTSFNNDNIQDSIIKIGLENKQFSPWCNLYNIDSFNIDSAGNKQKIIYYKYEGRSSIAGLVQYKEGNEVFSDFCDSMYYHREDYNYEELNAKAFFWIIFNKNLEIKEIRILKHIGYDNSDYNYDKLIENILRSTEGRWEKVKSNDLEEYIYTGFFNLR